MHRSSRDHVDCCSGGRAITCHAADHAKGICFTGVFDANGAGAELSKAQVFARGQYPALGRFNLGTPNPDAADATVRIRGFGIRITTPDGQEWRSAMIDAPVFPVSTPPGFYELLIASGSKDPNAIKAFATTHPELAAFGDWEKNAPWTSSYSEDQFNSLNSFVFVDGSGVERAVRWSVEPEAPYAPVDPQEKNDPDFLSKQLDEQIEHGNVRWHLIVTVANAGDQVIEIADAA